VEATSNHFTFFQVMVPINFNDLESLFERISCTVRTY